LKLASVLDLNRFSIRGRLRVHGFPRHPARRRDVRNSLRAEACRQTTLACWAGFETRSTPLPTASRHGERREPRPWHQTPSMAPTPAQWPPNPAHRHQPPPLDPIRRHWHPSAHGTSGRYRSGKTKAGHQALWCRPESQLRIDQRYCHRDIPPSRATLAAKTSNPLGALQLYHSPRPARRSSRPPVSDLEGSHCANDLISATTSVCIQTALPR